ncbi:MAG: hypothetical protein LAP85_14235 [Acidobacteriia bacterium]|nr:hypothetical protein [Terriglobia bacterium]
MPSGKDYASRLQEETRRTLATHIHGFEQELRTLQSSLAASVAQIAQRLAPILEIEIPAVEAIISDAVSERALEGARRRADEMLHLAHFAHDLRRKETQEEILISLLDGAHRYAPRLALFVTRGAQFVGWSSRGFTEEAAQKLNKCVFALSETPLLRNALEADGLTTAHDLSRETVLPQLLSGGMEGPWHAFPMKAIGRPVAVLLASAAEGRGCDLEPLCILMDLTGLCVENMALKVLHEIKVARSSASVPAAHRAAGEPAVEAVPAAAAGVAAKPVAEAPLMTPAEAPIPHNVPQQGTPEAAVPPELHVEPGAQEAESHAVILEPPPAADSGLEAGQPPEACESAAAVPEREQPPPTVAEAAADEMEPPAPEAPEPVRTAVLREVQPLTEEEKLHADARRFARLLASEIKLYNEQRVMEGRNNRDLYTRLKRDIDRSRDMYEKRVSPLVSRKVDYFHDEVIRILGDNDPSTLGGDYPGPRVEG